MGDWFYIQFAVIGSGVDVVKVRSVVVYRADSEVASQAVREYFSSEGTRVLIMLAELAVREQMNSRSILYIK